MFKKVAIWVGAGITGAVAASALFLSVSNRIRHNRRDELMGAPPPRNQRRVPQTADADAS